MPKGKLRLQRTSDRGYVPAHSSHRVCSFVFSALLVFWTACAYPDSLAGLVAELVEDAELQKEPRTRSASFGLLPKGTLLRILDEPSGSFVPVEVELDSGPIEGWIRQRSLNTGTAPPPPASAEAIDPENLATGPSTDLRPKTRRRVPKDEGLLLRRAPSFFYGLHGGGNSSIVNAIDGNSFMGMGFGVGGHLGTYVKGEFPLRLEVTYTLLNGLDLDGIPVGFGFLDTGISGTYEIVGFELTAKVSYAFGMGVTDLPGELNDTFETTDQLGSFWLGGGMGYRFSLSEMTSLSARLTYQFSVLQDPFSFHVFGLALALDIQG